MKNGYLTLKRSNCMKRFCVFILLLLGFIKAAAITEYPIDFSVSTSEYEMSFVIKSSTNNTVALSGEGEYDDGDRYYDPAVELKLGDVPYNIMIPQTVTNGNNTYNVVEISDGAFGNGSRISTERVEVHYSSMPDVSSIYSLILPSTIATINSMPTDIRILKCCATTPPTLNKKIPSSCSVIYVPESSLSAYQSADGWSNYASRMVGYNTNSNLISDISFLSKLYETNLSSPLQLTPTVTPGSSASNISWSSSNPSVATVDASGLVTGASVGTCYITATSSEGVNVFSTVRITVVPTPPITNITLNELAKTLYLGDFLSKVTLTATITPSESAGVGVTWSSSNPDIATVNQDGVVTAVSEGNTTITCSANDESGVTANCQITVKALSSIKIGTGTNNSTTAPFHSTNKNNEVFIKYTSREIGSAGRIQVISFDENWGYGYINNISVEIWMGSISNSSFYTSTTPSGNEMLSQMTRVFDGLITIEPNNNASTSLKRQRNIILDSPFEYDGSSDLNIFIATYFPSTSTSLKYDYTTTSANTLKYRSFDNSVTPSSWSWSNGNNRPNIRFWFDGITKSINNSDISISSISSVTYNGLAQTPAITVKDGSTTLVSGTDYTVAYTDNVNAGTSTVTVTGIGNYSGTKTATFTINKAPLTATAQIYTITQGDALPEFEVHYSGFVNDETASVLTTAPTASCTATSSSAPGTYDITVSGGVATNYDFTYVSGTLTINAKSESNLTIDPIPDVTYNGRAQEPAVTVKDGLTTLTSGTDYTVAYSDNINAGTATVTVTGIGNHTGTATANFTIKAKSLSGGSAETDSEGFSYINEFAYVKDISNYAGSGDNCYFTDCTQHITAPGKMKANVFCVENFYGVSEGQSYAHIRVYGNQDVDTEIGQFNFCWGWYKLNIDGHDFQFVDAYDNMAIGDTRQLACGNDMVYTITLLDKIASDVNSKKKLVFSINHPLYFGGGKDGSVGIRNFSNRVQIKYVSDGTSSSGNTISPISDVTYNGLAQTPAVTVKDGSTTLKQGTDYTVAYSDNVNAGTATVTVTGTGNYSGTMTSTFTIKKASLKATAQNYTILQGNALPTFEIQYSGFVNDETASVLTTAPTASCTATSSSVPGTYDITVSGGAATNYDFTYVNGTLTINQFNGDVNGDGVIDIADAVMIVNYIVGKLGTQSRE